MIKKEEIEFFKDKKATLFLYNKFVHCGFIKHIGDSCLVLDDDKKGLKTVQFTDIQEVTEYRPHKGEW